MNTIFFDDMYNLLSFIFFRKQKYISVLDSFHLLNLFMFFFVEMVVLGTVNMILLTAPNYLFIQGELQQKLELKVEQVLNKLKLLFSYLLDGKL